MLIKRALCPVGQNMRLFAGIGLVGSASTRKKLKKKKQNLEKNKKNHQKLKNQLLQLCLELLRLGSAPLRSTPPRLGFEKARICFG